MGWTGELDFYLDYLKLVVQPFIILDVPPAHLCISLLLHIPDIFINIDFTYRLDTFYLVLFGSYVLCFEKSNSFKRDVISWLMSGSRPIDRDQLFFLYWYSIPTNLPLYSPQKYDSVYNPVISFLEAESLLLL